jgi:hypothetical protein
LADVLADDFIGNDELDKRWTQIATARPVRHRESRLACASGRSTSDGDRATARFEAIRHRHQRPLDSDRAATLHFEDRLAARRETLGCATNANWSSDSR